VALIGAGDGAGAPWSGPPRLAEVAPGGALRANGLAAPDIAAAPALLTGEGAAGRLMALRGGPGAWVQGIADAALALGRAGFSDIAAAP
jgi:hypothetical protein